MLRILGWNVHGLCDKLDKNDFVKILKGFHICVLSETWESDNTILDCTLEGFEYFYSNRIQTGIGRPNGGIIIYYDALIKKGISVYNMRRKSEDILWFKLDKNFFSFDNNLYVCAIYMPNESSTRNKKLGDLFGLLEENIIEIVEKGDYMIVGDLNSRIGNRNDFVLDETHFFANTFGINPNGFIRNRTSEDLVVNNFGKKLLDLCISCDLRVLNGRAHEDANVGRYTFYQHNGFSVNDYFILHENILPINCHFSVWDFNEFSDHSPVVGHFKMKFPRITSILNFSETKWKFFL